MTTVLEVWEVGRHRYIVFLRTSDKHYERVDVRARNEYKAVLKALRGRMFMRLFLIR